MTARYHGGGDRLTCDCTVGHLDTTEPGYPRRAWHVDHVLGAPIPAPDAAYTAGATVVCEPCAVRHHAVSSLLRAGEEPSPSVIINFPKES